MRDNEGESDRVLNRASDAVPRAPGLAWTVGADPGHSAFGGEGDERRVDHGDGMMLKDVRRNGIGGGSFGTCG